MTLQADATGKVVGKFTIPAGVPAGAKEVVFTGAAGTRARATFIGQGTRLIETRQLVTWTLVAAFDPLAETFTLDAPQQITGVDIWFTAKGTSPVELQIRETSNGVPTQTVIAAKRLLPASINVAGNWTTFLFDFPVSLLGGTEYAIVVLCDDSDAAVAIAELGKFDSAAQKWVTAQPYQVGVLLSSSNASTWTPHQDRDMAFRLLRANYTATTRTIPLGTVAVVNATDLSVRANVESPSSAASCTFLLQLPDGSTQRVVADQVVRLSAPVSGNIVVSAELLGTAQQAPVLHRDVQLVWGEVDTTGTYVSRAITGGTDVKLRVIVEVNLPGSSSIAVSGKGTADGAWAALTQTASEVMQDGWVELTYESATLTKPLLHTKIELSGTSQFRPQARNLRALVV